MEVIKERKNILLLLFTTFVLSFFFINMSFRGGGDDIKFVTMAENYSLFGWIVMRFNTWSARIASEAFIYIFAKLPLFCWKTVTMTVCLLMSAYLYKFALLFKATPCATLAIACSFAPFLMNAGAFVEGSLWVTGAMNYSWIALPGIIGMYYIAKSVVLGQHSLKLPARIIIPILLLLCVSSSEQMGAVIVVLLGLLNVWQITKKQTSLYNILLFAGCFALFVTVVLLAPGVALRKIDDVARYIPNFETVALSLRLQYSVRWILDAIVNHYGLLFNALWSVLLIAFWSKKSKGVFDTVLAVVILFAEIITLFKEKFASLFDFSAKWGLTAFPKFSYFSIVLWAFILLCTVAAVYRCFESKNKGVIASLLILAAYASTCLMILSATMYESGCRVTYHSSLIVIVLILLLIAEIKENTKLQTLAVLSVLGFGMYQFAYLTQALSHGFTIHIPW